MQRDGVKELKVPRHRTDHPHNLAGWSTPECLTEIAGRAGKEQLYSHGHDDHGDHES